MTKRCFRIKKSQLMVLALTVMAATYCFIFAEAPRERNLNLTRRTTKTTTNVPVRERRNTINLDPECRAPNFTYYGVFHNIVKELKYLNIVTDFSGLGYIERRIEEALVEEKGTGCTIPKLDPFAKEVTQFDKPIQPIKCDGIDWVNCYLSLCRVRDDIFENVSNIECTFEDIIYENDNKYIIGLPVTVRGKDFYRLKTSDHVKIQCTGEPLKTIYPSKWWGCATGLRKVTPNSSPADREDALNVLILAFDSTSKNGFIRRMPKSYKYLKESLNAVILNGYNVVGDGTPAALFPIFTGKAELELPDTRKELAKNNHLDATRFIFYNLKKDGYRTAYFEDRPDIGTFQYRFNGFLEQPSDHYLRAFFLEESKNKDIWWWKNNKQYCVGDTPRHVLMLDLTHQFFELDAKKYCFTFISDITHDDFNMISLADDNLLDFMKKLNETAVLENTLFLLMGDHGPRYANVRDTLQGKQEERLPLMSLVLPPTFVRQRPRALDNLKQNAEVLTTPFDIHSTVLDAIGLPEFSNEYRVAGSDIPRAMSLFEKIPSNRSCSEAGIEPHWCACLHWKNVSSSELVYQKAADAFVEYINSLTEPQRSKCAMRTLITIVWVMRLAVSSKMLAFKYSRDVDGYLGTFGDEMKIPYEIFQIKVIVGPGRGTYEASMKYQILEDRFELNARDISRTNAYGNEPNCISATHPHLNMYCYCYTD